MPITVDGYLTIISNLYIYIYIYSFVKNVEIPRPSILTQPCKFYAVVG